MTLIDGFWFQLGKGVADILMAFGVLTIILLATIRFSSRK